MDKGEVELKTGPFGTQLHASDYVHEGTPVITAVDKKVELSTSR